MKFLVRFVINLLFRFRSKSLFSAAPIIIGVGEGSDRNHGSWSVVLFEQNYSVVISGFNPNVSWIWAMKKRIGIKVMNGNEVLIDKKLLSDIVFPQEIPSNVSNNYVMYSSMDQFESDISFINNIFDIFDSPFFMWFANFIFIGFILCCFGLFLNRGFKGIHNLYTRIKNYMINDFVINHIIHNLYTRIKNYMINDFVINHYSILFFVLFFMILALYGYFMNIPLLAIFGGGLLLLFLFVSSLYRFDKTWHEYVESMVFNDLVIKINSLLLKILKLNISQDKCYYWVHKFITISGYFGLGVMLGRLFVPLCNLNNFILNYNESHNYIYLLPFVIFILLFMSLFIVYMDIAIYKKRQDKYNKWYLAIAFFILFLLFLNIIMLIGFPIIYWFFIEYFLYLTLLTEVVYLFIEFNIFIPVMCFLFRDIPLYLSLNGFYIRLMDSLDSLKLYCYNCFFNNNNKNIQSKSFKMSLPLHSRNLSGTNLVSKVVHFVVNLLSLSIIKFMRVFPSRVRIIAEPIRYKINYNLTYKALINGKSNFVKFATGVPFTVNVYNNNNVFGGSNTFQSGEYVLSADGGNNQSVVGSVDRGGVNSLVSGKSNVVLFPRNGSLYDRSMFLEREDRIFDVFHYSPFYSDLKYIDPNIKFNEFLRLKFLDPFVIYNKKENNSGSARLFELVNLYRGQCTDKEYGLKMAYSYINGYQANELTIAFANICKLYTLLNTYDVLFVKRGKMSIFQNQFQFKDYSMSKEGFVNRPREFLSRGQGPVKFFGSLVDLQKLCAQHGFILSGSDFNSNPLRDNGSNVYLNTYGLVNFYQVCIGGRVLFVVDNGVLAGGIREESDFNLLLYYIKARLHKIKSYAYVWSVNNIKDTNKRNLLLSEIDKCFSEFNSLYAMRVRFIKSSVFNFGLSVNVQTSDIFVNDFLKCKYSYSANSTWSVLSNELNYKEVFNNLDLGNLEEDEVKKAVNLNFQTRLF